MKNTRGLFSIDGLRSAAEAVSVAIVTCALVFYVTCTYRWYLNSDSAHHALLAELAIREGRLIPASWMYVSNDIQVLSTVLLLPFVWLLGPSPVALMAPQLIGMGILGASVFNASRAVGADRQSSLLASALCAAGISLISSEMIVAQFFSVQFAMQIFIVTCAIRYLSEPVQPKLLWLIGLTIALLSFQNPTRVQAFTIIPLGLMLIAKAFREKFWRGPATIMVVAALGFVMGSAFHDQLIASGLVQMRAQYSSWSLADYATVSENSAKFIEMSLMFVDAQLSGSAGANITPLALLYVAVRISEVGALLWLSFWTARTFSGSAGGMLAIYASAGLVATIIALLLGPAIRPWYGIYYLCPFVIAMLPMLVSWSGRLKASHRAAVSALIICPALFLSVHNHVIFADGSYANNYVSPGINNQTSAAEKAVLAQWLLSRNLTAGYVRYWDANQMTVQSSGALRPASLGFFKRPMPFRWASSDDQLRDVGQIKPNFMALAVGDPELPLSFPPACDADHVNEETVGSYVVYLFPEGVAACMGEPVIRPPKPW